VVTHLVTPLLFLFVPPSLSEGSFGILLRGKVFPCATSMPCGTSSPRSSNACFLVELFHACCPAERDIPTGTQVLHNYGDLANVKRKPQTPIRLFPGSLYIERVHPASASIIQSGDSPKLGTCACVRTAKNFYLNQINWKKFT
jgi:hypothetical protein